MTTPINNLQLFSYENKEIRTVLIKGEPWWVAKDVCELLGYKDPTTAVKSHCRDGVQKLHPIVDSLGRIQDVRIIADPDLLRLIVGSTLPEAIKFEKWIFEVVLPQIRRTGTYITQTSKDDLLKELKNEAASMFAPVLQEFNSLLTSLESKEGIAAQELLTPEEVSKRLGLSVNTLRNWRYLKIGPKPTLIGRLVRYTESALLDFIEETKKLPVEMKEPTVEPPVVSRLQERKKMLRDYGLKVSDLFRMIALSSQLNAKNGGSISGSDLMTLALDALSETLIPKNQ